MKIIGILGGTGPVATENLYRRIIEICQKKYNAVQDSDYPPILLVSFPLSGTNETGISDESLAFLDFKYSIDKLIKGGSEFIIIPCNTVHHLLERLRKDINVPILSMTEAITKEVLKAKAKNVGILSSA